MDTADHPELDAPSIDSTLTFIYVLHVYTFRSIYSIPTPSLYTSYPPTFLPHSSPLPSPQTAILASPAPSLPPSAPATSTRRRIPSTTRTRTHRRQLNSPPHHKPLNIIAQKPRERSLARLARQVHHTLQRPNSGGELAVGAEFGEHSRGGQVDVGLSELPALAGQEGVALAGYGAGD